MKRIPLKGTRCSRSIFMRAAGMRVIAPSGLLFMSPARPVGPDRRFSRLR